MFGYYGGKQRNECVVSLLTLLRSHTLQSALGRPVYVSPVPWRPALRSWLTPQPWYDLGLPAEKTPSSFYGSSAVMMERRETLWLFAVLSLCQVELFIPQLWLQATWDGGLWWSSLCPDHQVSQEVASSQLLHPPVCDSPQSPSFCLLSLSATALKLPVWTCLHPGPLPIRLLVAAGSSLNDRVCSSPSFYGPLWRSSRLTLLSLSLYYWHGWHLHHAFLNYGYRRESQQHTCEYKWSRRRTASFIISVSQSEKPSEVISSTPAFKHWFSLFLSLNRNSDLIKSIMTPMSSKNSA